MFTERVIQLIADSQIEQAYRDGQFDRLPGFGQPFSFNELVCEPNWWLQRKLQAEQLKPHPVTDAIAQRL